MKPKSKTSDPAEAFSCPSEPVSAIKKILVPLDPSPYCEAALSFACQLAKQHQAEVSGLVVLDTPGIEKSIGAVPVGAMYYAERRVAEEEKRISDQIHGLLQVFTKTCDEHGVRHAEVERHGQPCRSIVQESHYHDLLVVGHRTYFRYGAGAGLDGVFGTIDDKKCDPIDPILDRCAVPVCGVPMAWKPGQSPPRVLIAYDGSVPSVRALHSFAQSWNAVQKELELILLNATSNTAQGRFLLDQAEVYLQGHGFTKIRKELTTLDIRAAMETIYLDMCDWVVLGAHSRAFLMDFMVGSVCKDLLLRAQKVLVIMH